MSTRLERELEEQGYMPPRKAVGGAKSRTELTRKAVDDYLRTTERLAAHAASAPVEEARPYVPIAHAGVRKATVWTVSLSFAAFVGIMASVPWQRLAHTEAELKESAEAKTSLACVDGHSTAMDNSSWWRWATGGSALNCTDWKTRDEFLRLQEVERERLRELRQRAAREARGY